MRTSILKVAALLGCLIAARSGCLAEDFSLEQRKNVPTSSDPETIFRGQSDELPTAWTADGETPYIQQFGGGYRFGDGVGFKNGYTDLEWMIPIRGDAEFDNFFADLHFLVRDDAKLGGNATLAYRRYNLDWNRIFGGYVFWDGTQTPLGNQLQQMGLGVETLGQFIDARANVYLPDAFELRGPLPNIFQGNSLIIHRAEVAMTGVDGEVGVNLPVIFNTRTRVLGGGYYFNGHGSGNTSGWKARVETEFNRNVWVDYSVQEDKLFGRTWNVGVTIRYAHRFLGDLPSPASMDHKHFRAEGVNSTRDLSDRLSDPIRRIQNVVLTRDDGVAATDPGGVPLGFIHVANGFAGTGTFENPYGTLTNALADGAAGTSIIYTPFGGNYVENVTLVPGARVLSNGPTQTVTTQFGDQQLPFSGSSTGLSSLPTITGNVSMANTSRFSGFDVTGGLTAAGVTGFTVDNSVITNPAGDAVRVTGATASTLTNLHVSSGAGRGLFLNNSAAAVTDLKVISATTNGLEVTTAATPRIVTVNNLTVDAAGAHGVDLNVTAAGALTYTQSGTINVKSTGNAFDAALGAGSTGAMNLTLGNFTLASTAGAGVNLDGTAGAGALRVVGLTSGIITTAATGGFLADTVTFDSNLTTPGNQQVSSALLTIGSSTDTTQVKGDGLRLIDPTGSLLIATLNVFNDTGTGVLIDTKGGGTTFALATSSGLITTTNGPAMSLDQAAIIKSSHYPTAMLLPMTFPFTDAGLAVGIRRITDAMGKPAVVYIKSEPYIQPETLKALVDEGRVASVKYAVVRAHPGKDDYLTALCATIDKRYLVSGIGERPAIEHLRDFGITSFTSGSVCLAPAGSMRLLELLKAKRYDEAEKVRAIFMPFEDCRDGISPLRVLHDGVTLAGVADMGPMLPMISGLSGAEKAQVKPAALALAAANNAFMPNKAAA